MTITLIEIILEEGDAGQPVYRATWGERQAVGQTPGQALDNLERILATVGGAEGEGTLVVVLELKEPTLASQVEQLADETDQPAEQVLEAVVRNHLDELERRAIHADTEAFWAMHDELLKKYEGEYVAMRRASVVDHDEDPSRLERRVRDRFGLLPVLIAPVEPGARRDLRWMRS